ncbi:proteasome assembly chaperone 4 [Iris pallida]|uniref:Proteasome assembly chaperone 4 n=1 Tax=Iris pallida TaxID=29817 RepID=A0AAX6EPG0_IRIPA|nr:proteasome assembly chaperone 4 [Iris pallida]KAJ6807288.1 proteasome assembly chaperone 4 [Iris pallida]
MAAEELDNRLSNLEMTTDPQCNGEGKSLETQAVDDDVQITCFTEDLQDTVLHFQIIRLPKQIYVWIGCNSVKFGHLYAGASTRPNNMVGVTALLGGTSDNTGSSIARRLVLKTGLSVVLACNIPKDSPMLEAAAERKLLEKLRNMGYVKHGDGGLSIRAAGPS